MSSHSDSEIRDGASKRLITIKKSIKHSRKDVLPQCFKAVKEFVENKPKNLKQEYLISCATFNDTERAEQLLLDGVDSNCCDLQRRTPLHISAAKGYEDMVKLLLKYGANPNVHDIVLNTPLHLAACTSNLAVVTLLINAGADITLLDLHGRNPVQLAKGKLDILRKSWKIGAIEMIKLKSQLEEIVEVMISLRKLKQVENNLNLTCNVEDLQLMKLSINNGPEEDIENQMSKLEQQLQDFKLK